MENVGPLVDRDLVTIEERNTQIVQFRRPFAMQYPETAWALLEAMVQRVREAEAR